MASKTVTFKYSDGDNVKLIDEKKDAKILYLRNQGKENFYYVRFDSTVKFIPESDISGLVDAPAPVAKKKS